MCGRFTLVRLSDFLDRFPWITPPEDLPEDPVMHYNIAPTQPVAAVTNDGTKVDYLRWGLVPSWAKDKSVGNRMINARAETLAEKPAFARLLKSRRCLIPADGFYEWRREPGRKTKTPMYIHMKDGHPFAFAGLWDKWRDKESGKTLRSFTIITTKPNELMRPIHDRMPMILRETDYRRWLSPGDSASPDELSTMLAPYPPAELEAYEVSPGVNSPANESPQNISPVPAKADQSAKVEKTTKSAPHQPSLFPE
jgi:putative SOS response-associated peptidase YedK